MRNIKSLELFSFSTSSLKEMNNIFFSCINLEKIDITNFSISSLSIIEIFDDNLPDGGTLTINQKLINKTNLPLLEKKNWTIHKIILNR